MRFSARAGSGAWAVDVGARPVLRSSATRVRASAVTGCFSVASFQRGVDAREFVHEHRERGQRHHPRPIRASRDLAQKKDGLPTGGDRLDEHGVDARLSIE
jgi:hypothetical protein